MGFGVALALAVGLLVAAPLVAHLLQRGRTREQEFPGAALVPTTPSTSRERRRFEDRSLLAIRIAMVLALAVLGATPLLKCDRLALSRNAGASVALAIVIDDSSSMRAVLPDGRTRFETAVEGARSLLSSAREGDAVTLVLAGRPARVALSATTDLSAAGDTLGEIRVSDRSTDLVTAVQLARAAVRSLPHADRRLAVLSDLAGDPLPQGAPPVWTPLPELAQPVADCGIVRATLENRQTRVTVACQSTDDQVKRSVSIVVSDDAPDRAGEEIASRDLPGAVGERTVVIEHENPEQPLDAVLSASEHDAIEADDTAPVTPRTRGLGVAVVVDRTLASAMTGGPTLLEQALSAIEPAPRIRPLPLLPRDAAALAEENALILDDPPGLSPEARTAVTEWVRAGGVAVAFLGPRATSAQLASTLEPFARGAVGWETSNELSVAPRSAPWLGEEAASLGELTRGGRARLDAAAPDGARIIARWEDDAPFVLERPLGRGVLLTVGLPISTEQSDLALRPGFIALLDHVLALARQRSNVGQSGVGEPWTFAGAKQVRVEGPEGPLEITRTANDTVPVATPDLAGRYRVLLDGRSETRVAVLDAQEILATPRPVQAGALRAAEAGEAGQVDVSREVALILLVLLLGELVLRVARGRGRRRQGASPSVPPAAGAGPPPSTPPVSGPPASSPPRPRSPPSEPPPARQGNAP